jgi:hypothetical protein
MNTKSSLVVVAGANKSGAMESDTIKNGCSSKSQMSRIVFIVMTVIFAAVLISCNKDKDKDDDGGDLRQADFYGIWKNKNNATRDISENTMIITTSQWSAIIRLKSITQVTNSDELTKSDYPNGFKFTGEITSITGSGVATSFGNVGDAHSPTYFMHNNKKSFMTEGSDDLGIYTKQP